MGSRRVTIPSDQSTWAADNVAWPHSRTSSLGDVDTHSHTFCLLLSSQAGFVFLDVHTESRSVNLRFVSNFLSTNLKFVFFSRSKDLHLLLFALQFGLTKLRFKLQFSLFGLRLKLNLLLFDLKYFEQFER